MESSCSMKVEKLDFPWCKLIVCFDNCSHLQQKPNIRLSEVPACFPDDFVGFWFPVGAWASSLFFPSHFPEALPLSQNMCCRVAVGLDIYEESTIPVIKDKIRVIPVLSSY